MEIFFLFTLIYFGKISSSRGSGKQGLYFESKGSALYNLGVYVLFKEFEEQNYENNIKLLNKQNMELNYVIKDFLTLISAKVELGGFDCYDFSDKIFDDFSDKIFNNLTEEEIKTHNSIYAYFMKHFDFEDLTAKKFKDLFYISNYLKNIKENHFNDYFKNNKKFYLTDLIDLLNLEDKEIIDDLKSGKSKNYIKSNLTNYEIIEKISEKIKCNIGIYEAENNKKKINKNYYNTIASKNSKKHIRNSLIDEENDDLNDIEINDFKENISLKDKKLTENMKFNLRVIPALLFVFVLEMTFFGRKLFLKYGRKHTLKNK